MQRQKRHWVLLHPIPPPTTQEHTFPAHVQGTPSKVFTSKWFGLSSCLKMEESCFNSLNPVQCCGKSIKRGRKEGYLVKADIAPPLAAPSHTPMAGRNYSGQLFHLHSCLCLNTWCVALQRQFKCFHSF